MTEDADNPRPRRRKKRVLTHRVMVSMNESLYQAMERISDETGVSLSVVGRYAIQSGLHSAKRELDRLHGGANTSSV
ncbi:MAG: hypothetical protein F4246_08530 [Rhodothermaceae bacterium]|nr:hypothetical protein [Rhodothermaceae bacterium]MXX57652.1 hypothetical protein [Rhodothermaceae bacterium]MYD19857.1 hypothetical protein [Rhodothermaceae bacterium]MYD57046.1 hypothetical protein [Rhodothermaceae bacterium]MYI44767.1 hypothetical protein [Rhodothermaceae bacterium]